MANYKNQNVITNITIDPIKHEQGISESWMQPFSWDKMMKILFLLNGNEYKFYMYLFSWAGKKQYDFSPADLSNKLGFKEDTARKIFKNFIQYGFLTPINNCYYEFNAYPKEIEQKYAEKYMREKVV